MSSGQKASADYVSRPARRETAKGVGDELLGTSNGPAEMHADPVEDRGPLGRLAPSPDKGSLPLLPMIMKLVCVMLPLSAIALLF